MNKKRKKVIAESILIIALIIFVISIIFNIGDPKEILNAIKGARYRYFFTAIGFLVIYIILYSLSLIILTRSSGVKTVKTTDLFLISSCEFFFNGITPGAVGGQPFQVFAYNQVGVPASKSTGIVLTNFLCSMIAQIILTLISLIYYPLIVKYAPGMIAVFWIGFIVNCFGAFIFISLGCSKKIKNVIVKIFNGFCGLKIMRKAKNANVKFEKYMKDAQQAFASCWANKPAFLLALTTKMCSYFALYSIPFFILKALKLPVGHERGCIDYTMIFEIICVTSFAMIAANYIPTPGAAGFLEFTFMYFFLPILIQTGSSPTVQEQAIASAGVLLWRSVTYYILMLFSFIDYVIFVKKKHITKVDYTSDSEYTLKSENVKTNNDYDNTKNSTIEEVLDSLEGNKDKNNINEID